MLTDWLAPKDMDWFMANHFQRAPHAAPGGALNALPLFDWGAVDRVLRSELPLDLLTVAAGRLMEVPRPRSLVEARRLMAGGVSVVVRAAERHDPGLRALASSFEQVLPGEVHVQLYATPAGTNSYGWHYDFEDVFIAQTLGVKDYYFRRNTVSADARLGETLDFSAVKREASPMMSARLIAGDWLYLPATWWHLVKCTEDALSISVGVMPPEALRRAKRLPAGWSGARAVDAQALPER
jgi:50S ribosomal protein L16 3-hydroxylase